MNRAEEVELINILKVVQLLIQVERTNKATAKVMKAVRSLDPAERQVVELRYLGVESEYITDVEIREKMQLETVHEYNKLRKSALQKIFDNLEMAPRKTK